MLTRAMLEPHYQALLTVKLAPAKIVHPAAAGDTAAVLLAEQPSTPAESYIAVSDQLVAVTTEGKLSVWEIATGKQLR